MKKLIVFILFLTAFSSTYSQSHIYSMFYFKGGLNGGTTYPFPIKISSLGNGKFEIISELDGGRGNKLEYSVTFIEYDKWEKLYKYRGIKKKFPQATASDKGANNCYVETLITCKTDLSDFVKGLKISPNDMVENYKINIAQTTSTNWSKDTRNYTIVFFNGNSRDTDKGVQKLVDKSNSTNTIKSSAQENALTSNTIAKNTLRTSYFKVISEKAYFHDEPISTSVRKAYLVSGERFFSNKSENGFVYTFFSNKVGQLSEGWIKNSDVAIEDSENSKDLHFLKNMNGKYPYEVMLLENQVLSKRMKNLIGNRYEFLKEKWNVQVPIEIKNSIFIATACEQHNCGITDFIILYDFTSDVLKVGIREDSQVKLYSENGEGCQLLTDWQNKNL